MFSRLRFLGQSPSLWVPLVLLAGAILLRQHDPQPIQQLRNLTFDTYQRLVPRPYDPTLPVRIGDIDEKSLEKFGQWPWPRGLMARIVDRLRELGAAAVALDVIYAEPDRTGPAGLAAMLPEDAAFDSVRSAIQAVPDPDQALAAAIARIPTVTAFATQATDPERPQELPLQKAGFAFAGDNPADLLPSWPYWITTMMPLQQAAAGIASVNAEPDFDGIIRRVPAFVRLPEPGNPTPFRPTLAIEALRVAQGAGTYQVKSSGASGEQQWFESRGIAMVKIGQAIMPTSANGGILLYDSGHQTERFFSLADLWNPDFDAAQVAGRIIFIGASVAGLRDYKPTPNAEIMTGIEIHAQIAEQIASGTYLTRPYWATQLEQLALLGFGLILVALAQKRAALFGLAVALIGIGGAFGGSFYLFRSQGFLLDPLYPAGIAFVIFVAATLLGYIRSEREKAFVRGAFSRYLSPALVDQLAAHPERLKLGGELRELTIMFCDIRGFTRLSEGLDPQALTHVINAFLTPMTEVIQRRQGTIDKYIGDCIMALWNAPLEVAPHGRMAVLAAFDMRAALIRINRDFATEAAASGAAPIEIRIGIGINTGLACVGNMGSEQRFDYSVLGDTVNIASRLEALSPVYAVDLVIGQETAATVPEFARIELDQVRVKGKAQPVRIYTVLGDETVAGSAAYQALLPAHQELLAAYRGKDWPAAEQALAEARRLAPDSLAGFYDLYAARIAEYRADPPPADWDGVHVARSKTG
ncbi:adenylate cyclase [Dongia mobilis]|uniref:Adenylate cyclase n=2 Tax=Dongia mobilis TaxID=578943 RepID=A0A4R6WZG1_9PROT|nr:adenylate cyclase [Dongia mobilis]